MKKIIAIFLPLLIVSVSSLFICFSLWNNGIYFNKNITGITYYNKEDLRNKLETQVLSNIELIFPSTTKQLTTSDFATVKVTFEDKSFRHYILEHKLLPLYSWEIDESKLLELLRKEITSNVDAKLILNSDGTITIQEEIQGISFDLDDAVNIICTNLRNQEYVNHLENLCTEPNITTKDLLETYNKVSWINTYKITYDMAGCDLTPKDFSICWDDNWNFDISKFDIDTYLTNLNELYDNRDSYGLFTTTSTGKTIRVPYYTYGRYVNIEKEKEFLLDALERHVSVDKRTPVLSGYNNWENKQSYIEISIQDQHIWHYTNNKLCCESPCVTGRLNKHDTPTGVFYVSEKIPGKYLRGADYVTWVNQWMRLTNSGIGLHDAYWRGSFGGSIYKSNGSHGCINLPKDYAKKLYSEIERGIPVVIYNE